jgi:hypothetical protein
MFGSSYTQRVQAIQSDKANEDTLELSTEGSTENSAVSEMDGSSGGD